MHTDRKTARLLGAAQLLVAVASAASGSALLGARIWSGSVADNLASIPDNLAVMRINLVGEQVTSMAILLLGAVFYYVFYRQYKVIALVALGLYWAEAITLSVSRMPAFSLLSLSQEFVKAGAPDAAYFETLGGVFYSSAQFGYTLHMVFFCVGALLWYYLFYRTRVIPRVLSVWGLVAIGLLSINILLLLYDPAIGNVWVLLAPYVPFELVLGVWLIVKGFSAPATASAPVRTGSDEA
jgi:hypothetical protein